MRRRPGFHERGGDVAVTAGPAIAVQAATPMACIPGEIEWRAIDQVRVSDWISPGAAYRPRHSCRAARSA